MYSVNQGLERTNVELKYCESCGALWLRKQGVTDVTCRTCVSMWEDLAGAWVERLRRKPAVAWRTVMSQRHSNGPELREGGVA